MNPLEPRRFLLHWSIPNYIGIAGTYVPYFGIGAWPDPNMVQTTDVRSGRFLTPLSLLVATMQLFSQFSPGDGNPETWTLFKGNGATAIGSVTRAGGAQSSPIARVGQLVNQGDILTMTETNAIAIGGGYNVICTLVCIDIGIV